MRLVKDRKIALELTAKPNLKHCTTFNKDLVAIHVKKTKLKLISQYIVE